MAKKKKQEIDALSVLLDGASREIMTELIHNLAAGNSTVKRQCLEFLESKIPASPEIHAKSQGDIVMGLWMEVEFDIHELDEYGGGEYRQEERVWGLLGDIINHLKKKDVDADSRSELIAEILPYIENGNSGLEDLLDEVAEAACYDDGDWRNLAHEFEKMNSSWRKHCARSIYRSIGDRDKYLELRLSDMHYGSDYYDLTAYYWKMGEKEKAIQTCEEGLRRAQGRMDELQKFSAERALEAGDRKKYLAIHFDLAVQCITLETYRKFKKKCTKEEWAEYEKQFLKKLKSAEKSNQLEIYLHRKEYDKAIGLFKQMKYPLGWDFGTAVEAAKELKTLYPEEVLRFYLSGLEDLNSNHPRKIYAAKARLMAKVRQVLLDVIKDKARWMEFACKVKKDNVRRPAFQEEFAHAIPDWNKLEA
ncbi:hypothetical protein [Desulfatibacillum aliphaticivorans]|uniref:hypothetical protein n=1 Tax=Desulfatibacillum aliphaticivorans TaxID=218208 RepID=UPI000403A3ED|nr:hypothetical protein [Desulfatibacillum aliphaticivorans]